MLNSKIPFLKLLLLITLGQLGAKLLFAGEPTVTLDTTQILGRGTVTPSGITQQADLTTITLIGNPATEAGYELVGFFVEQLGSSFVPPDINTNQADIFIFGNTSVLTIFSIDPEEAGDVPAGFFDSITSNQQGKDWIGQDNVTHDGIDALRSGPVDDGEQTEMIATVNGPGTLSFFWKVSSEADADSLELLVDQANAVPSISGEVDWSFVTLDLSPGEKEVTWRYRKDALGSSGEDAAWVDEITYVPTTYTLTLQFDGGTVETDRGPLQPVYGHEEQIILLQQADPGFEFIGWCEDNTCVTNDVFTFLITEDTIIDALFSLPFAEAADTLDNTDISWQLPGNVSDFWIGQRVITHDGENALQSGPALPGQTSAIQATVGFDNPGGQLTYKWKVESGSLVFYIDGVEQSRIPSPGAIPDGNGWVSSSLTIPSGPLTFNWQYINDGNGSGQEKSWLDEVTINPSTVNLTHSIEPAGGGSLFFLDSPLNEAEPAPFILGSLIEVVAVPNLGYEFIGWIFPTSNANTTSFLRGDNGLQLTMDQNKMIEAYFRIPFDIALDDEDDRLDFTIDETRSPSLDWYGQAATTQDGVDAIKSGRITDNQTTSLQTTVRGPGTFSFFWKVSSETDKDFLRFLIDANPSPSIPAISGEVDWQEVSFEVPDSTFTYTWEYAKDNAGNDGDDAAYLDQVIFQPTQYTLTVNTSSAGVISRNLDQPTYDAHFVVVLEAVPEPGFTFQSWTTDIPDINLTDNPLSFPMEDNYTITANWSGIASYDTWKSIRFEGQPFPQDGDNEDPDGNGIANLLEYALGFSPQTPISNLAGNNLLPIFSIENNQSQLTFNRLKGAADINYIVEVSEDLFQWQSGSGITQVISVVDQGGTDAVTVADQTNVNILNKRFMRLNIQRQ